MYVRLCVCVYVRTQTNWRCNSTSRRGCVYDVVQCAEGEFCSHSFGCLPSYAHSNIYYASHEEAEDEEKEEEIISVPIEAHTQTHIHTQDAEIHTHSLTIPLILTHPYTSGSTRYTHDEVMTTLTHVSPSLTRSGINIPTHTHTHAHTHTQMQGERERVIGFVEWDRERGVCAEVSMTERPIVIRNTVSVCVCVCVCVCICMCMHVWNV